MKCIQCGIDNTLRDRTKHFNRCKNCNHLFAFEPAIFKDYRSGLTDAFFAKAINDISANGTLYFTLKQLLYLIDKRLVRKIYSNNGQGLGCFLIIVGIAFISTWLGYVLIIVGIVLLLPKGKQNRQPQLPQPLLVTQNQFQDWLLRWQQINGAVVKMLPPPRNQLAPTTVSSDVSAYSFDRVVVCDSAAIAQLLINNNFHFENNCAVLSITGYPQSIFATVMEMLRRNPDLQVYALHDASPQGVSLVHQLGTDPDWFQNSSAVIFDLGLSPRQILASRNIVVRSSTESSLAAQQLPEAVRQGLSQAELQWLDSGNFVELESFTPERIIRVLNQGIAQSQNPQSSDGLVLVDYGGYGSESYIFAADNFG